MSTIAGDTRRVRGSHQRHLRTFAIAWQLARLDLIRRYTATGLGLAWAILAPLGMAVVIGTVFSQLFDQALAEFLPYLFMNLTLWAFFVACIEGGTIAFFAAAGYIKQVPNVSLVAYPLRMTLAAFVVLLLGLAAVAVISLIFGAALNLSWLSLVPGLAAWVLFGFAVATLSAVLNTMARDFEHLQSVVVQALFYATPVMYPPRMLTEHGLGWLLTINPLYHMMMLVRTPVVYGDIAPLPHFLATGLVLAILLPAAWLVMRRARHAVVFWL
jgi:ABC-type polysaccharide/polyol phosphate export permease